MKILIAPDSFKESLSAQNVCRAIAHALEGHQLEMCPMADGGEGTLEILLAERGGKLVHVKTVDSLLRPINAAYGILNDGTAVIELATASGLHLLQTNERNPLLTSTFGTGILMKDAVKKGIHKFLLTLGGSATNDGGTGIAHALGVKFHTDSNEAFLPTGGTLNQITAIDYSNIPELSVSIACDVTNPLLGETGAAHTFSPQKGANAEQVIELESNMEAYAQLLKRYSELDTTLPGLGAAGGTSLSLIHFFRAQLTSGIDLISRTTGLEEKIRKADVIITGEGKFDSQSLEGKVVSKILCLANKYNKKVIILCGSSDQPTLPDNVTLISLTDYFPLTDCLSDPVNIITEVCNHTFPRILGQKKT